MGHVRFEELMGKREKMMEQIEIDEELFNKPAMKDEQNIYLLPTFYLHSQQLILANPTIVITKLAKNFEHYLTTYLYGNIYKAKAFERKISEALQKVTEVVDNWSNKNARLLISGSLLLNAHTIGSDVNLVCLTPGERLTRIEFMGNDKNAKCLQNKCTERTNASLFCRICEHKSTSNLIKIDSESILLIRFTFDGIEFDISLVAVPTMQNLEHKINDNELENLLKRFNWSNSEHKHLIRSLSSYRSTLYICNLLLYNEMCPKERINIQMDNKDIFNENRRHFRLLLVTLKIWAKNNFIYSNKMGFLNGMTLAIMVTKIVLLYPNASIQFLLEKFFLFYSTRRIQMPVQIAKINKTDQDLISNGAFSLLNAKEFDMPTLTPAFPVQNVTRLVTHSNAKVIRREMIKALTKIKAMDNNNKQFELAAFLDGSVPFTQKYDNFVVILCIAEQKEKADAFCGFVEWRMRLQIIFDIDKKGGSIETHLYPDVYQQNCNLPTNFVKPSFRANFCKVWLLGISSASISGTINNNLFEMAQQFDTTIKRHYYLKTTKGPTANQLNVDDYFKAMKMELKSVMAKKEELFGF
uniref:polynucleotide adenylyltransferase n=1 Tax=Globodera rostochiensis TaxID=31243 RepID=A0A914I0Q9_GLORO